MTQSEFAAAIGTNTFTENEYMTANRLYLADTSRRDNRGFLAMYATIYRNPAAIAEMCRFAEIIEGQASAVQGAEDALSALRKERKRQDEQIHSLTDDYETISDEFDAKCTELDAANKEIARLTAALESAKKDAEGMARELGNVRRQLDDQDAQIINLAEVLTDVMHNEGTDLDDDTALCAMTASVAAIGRRKYLLRIVKTGTYYPCEEELLTSVLDSITD